MEINKRQILISFLETIQCISDKEYQKRVWIQGEGPEIDDFDETCCNFFGDGDPLLEKYKEFGITESQHRILKQFRDEFRIFSKKHYWPSEFIDTPEWEKVIETARNALRAFDYKKGVVA